MTFHGEAPQYSDELVKPAIIVTFRIGKFYNKIFTPIGEDQVKFTEIAIEWYNKGRLQLSLTYIIYMCTDSRPHSRTGVLPFY